MSRIKIGGLENYGLVRDTYFQAKSLSEDSVFNHDQLNDLYLVLVSRDNLLSVELLRDEVGKKEFLDVLRKAKYGKYENIRISSTTDSFGIEPIEIDSRLFRIYWSKQAEECSMNPDVEQPRLKTGSDLIVPSLKEYFASIKLLYSYKDSDVAETPIYQEAKKIFEKDFSSDELLLLNSALDSAGISEILFDKFKKYEGVEYFQKVLAGICSIDAALLSFNLFGSRSIVERVQIFDWLVKGDVTIRMDMVVEDLFGISDQLLCLGDGSNNDVKAKLSLYYIDLEYLARGIIVEPIDV